jgi:hypothetical protein
MRWCVTINGNLKNFESPAGVDHIRDIEGYALCSLVGTAFDGGSAGDGGFAGNGIVLAQSSSSITIQRDTADGRLRLVQKFTRDTSENDVTITATVTNRTGAEINAIQLSRYADFDIDTTSDADVFEDSLDGVWASEMHGVTLSATSFNQGLSNKGVEPFSTLITTFAGCDPDLVATPAVGMDATARVTYFIGTINGGQSKTVKFVYRRQ